ncbi:hypothetical protein HN873_038040 [Arachis hypogaea]
MAICSAIPQSQSLLFGVKGSELFRVVEANAAENLIQPEKNLFEWVKNDNRRFLHVVYRVGDLDKTIKYTNSFVGYGLEDSNFTVELTYNYGVDKYDIGNGFGHLGVVVEDATKAVDLIKAKGGKAIKEPGPVKGGSTAIGMQLLHRKDNPEHKVNLCWWQLLISCAKYSCHNGYGPEDKNIVLELTYIYGITNYEKGNGYGQIAIGTNDVYKSAEAIKLCGGKIIREPGPLPGINTKIAVCLDPRP